MELGKVITVLFLLTFVSGEQQTNNDSSCALEISALREDLLALKKIVSQQNNQIAELQRTPPSWNYASQTQHEKQKQTKRFEELEEMVSKSYRYHKRLIDSLYSIVKRQEKRISDLENSNDQLTELLKQKQQHITTTENSHIQSFSHSPNTTNQAKKRNDNFQNVPINAEVHINNNIRKERLLLPTTPSVPSKQVAFYAYMASSVSISTPDHILKFDVVKTNVGNSYHPSSGVFIAPRSGLYVFSWTIRQNGDSTYSVELIVNNNALGSSFLRTEGGNDETITSLVVVQVSQGDDVYMRTHSTYTGNTGYIRSDGYSRSSFAGWILN